VRKRKVSIWLPETADVEKTRKNEQHLLAQAVEGFPCPEVTRLVFPQKPVMKEQSGDWISKIYSRSNTRDKRDLHWLPSDETRRGAEEEDQSFGFLLVWHWKWWRWTYTEFQRTRSHCRTFGRQQRSCSTRTSLDVGKGEGEKRDASSQR